MTSKELLEKICYIPIYEEDEHNEITDINTCCLYKGDLCEVYENEISAIEKDLDRLEKLERIFEILQRHLYVCSIFIEGRITTEKNFREGLSNSWTKFYNGMKVIDEDYYELYDLWNELIKEKK